MECQREVVDKADKDKLQQLEVDCSKSYEIYFPGAEITAKDRRQAFWKSGNKSTH